MSSQKASPARADAKRFGSEEILLAETGVFANRDGLRFQGRPGPDADFIAADFDGPAERRRKPGRQLLLKNGMVNQQGDSRVGCPQQNDEQQKPLDRALPTATFGGAVGRHVSRSDRCGVFVDDQRQGWFSQFKCLPACKRMRDVYLLQDERRSAGHERRPAFPLLRNRINGPREACGASACGWAGERPCLQCRGRCRKRCGRRSLRKWRPPTSKSTWGAR